jgi:predicted dehydrogenase
MSIIKIGLIGAGSIGVRHIMAIDALPDVALVAIGDPSPAAQKIGTERSIPVFAGADKMLSAGGIDAVIIATPTERHHQDVMAALRHKVTVQLRQPSLKRRKLHSLRLSRIVMSLSGISAVITLAQQKHAR